MLLMVEKGARGGMCHAITRCDKGYVFKIDVEYPKDLQR